MTMMKSEYKEIDEEVLKEAYRKAWSIENRAAHGADDRTVTYIGSTVKENIITDYFRDTTGCYWFRNRAITEYGEIVSMKKYIFG